MFDSEFYVVNVSEATMNFNEPRWAKPTKVFIAFPKHSLDYFRASNTETNLRRFLVQIIHVRTIIAS